MTSWVLSCLPLLGGCSLLESTLAMRDCCRRKYEHAGKPTLLAAPRSSPSPLLCTNPLPLASVRSGLWHPGVGSPPSALSPVPVLASAPAR